MLLQAKVRFPALDEGPPHDQYGDGAEYLDAERGDAGQRDPGLTHGSDSIMSRRRVPGLLRRRKSPPDSGPDRAGMPLANTTGTMLTPGPNTRSGRLPLAMPAIASTLSVDIVMSATRIARGVPQAHGRHQPLGLHGLRQQLDRNPQQRAADELDGSTPAARRRRRSNDPQDGRDTGAEHDASCR
jgi:hypothetical protein